MTTVSYLIGNTTLAVTVYCYVQMNAVEFITAFTTLVDDVRQYFDDQFILARVLRLVLR